MIINKEILVRSSITTFPTAFNVGQAKYANITWSPFRMHTFAGYPLSGHRYRQRVHHLRFQPRSDQKEMSEKSTWRPLRRSVDEAVILT